MSFSEALVQSCDTVYYQLGYDMWRETISRLSTRAAIPRPPSSRWCGWR